MNIIVSPEPNCYCKKHNYFVKAGLYDPETKKYARNCGLIACPVHGREAAQYNAATKAEQIGPHDKHFEAIVKFRSQPLAPEIQGFISALRNFIRRKRLPCRLNSLVHYDPGDWHIHMSFVYSCELDVAALQEMIMCEIMVLKMIRWEAFLTPPEDWHDPVAWTWYVWRARPEDERWCDRGEAPPGYQVPYWSQRPRKPLHRDLHPDPAVDESNLSEMDRKVSPVECNFPSLVQEGGGDPRHL